MNSDWIVLVIIFMFIAALLWTAFGNTDVHSDEE